MVFDWRHTTYAGQRDDTRRQGFTLVELIVVLAVMAMMAAVAIPAFSKMGLFSKDNLRDCARKVHSQLSAARIYAATNHANTAVVYDPDPTAVKARRSMMVYQPAKGADYLPVPGTEGDFDVFPEETCLFPKDDSGEILKEINIDLGDKLADPATVDVVTRKAIVFEPNGRIQTTADKEKYRLRLTYTEDADPLLRYTDEAATQERMITIELQRSTGRARIEEDEHE